MKNLPSVLTLILAVNASAQTKPWLEGQHSGIKQPLAVAIQNPQKWGEIWRRHDASASVPEVDFAKQSVVAVFLGRTATAGVTVTLVVQRDPIDSDRLNVFYRRTAIKKDFSAQVQCEPYAMVKVPRAAVIDVEQDGRASIPERGNPPATSKREDGKVRALIEGLATRSFDGNRP